MSTPNLTFSETRKSEATSPTSSTMSNSWSHPEKVSVIKDSLEERGCSDLVDEEEAVQSISSWAKALFGKQTILPPDLDAIATRRSVFDESHLARFYWPRRDYENIHRLDPSARWTYREEKVGDLLAAAYILQFVDCH